MAEHVAIPRESISESEWETLVKVAQALGVSPWNESYPPLVGFASPDGEVKYSWTEILLAHVQSMKSANGEDAQATKGKGSS